MKQKIMILIIFTFCIAQGLIQAEEVVRGAYRNVENQDIPYRNEYHHSEQLRWAFHAGQPRMLSVYIDKRPIHAKLYKPEYDRLVDDALKQWGEASAGYFCFGIVERPVDSDIRIYWVGSFSHPEAPHVGETDIIPKKTRSGRFIGHANIRVQTWNMWNMDRAIPAYEIERFILHELGHALGLAHSYNGDDIMYPGRPRPVNLEEMAEHPPKLSPGDKAALLDLYASDWPDKRPVYPLKSPQAEIDDFTKAVQSLVKSHWNPNPAMSGQRIVFMLKIARNGDLLGYNQIESSGKQSLDRLAVRAIQAVGLFPAIPKNSFRDYMYVLVTFD